MNVAIRRETLEDIHEIDLIVQEAFKGDLEVRLVQSLRNRGELVVSLVAEHDETIVGHVAASLVTVDEISCSFVGIAPLAVLPAHQKQGIGASLMHAVLEQTRDHGFTAAVLLGDPKYYPRFGFKPASQFNLDNEYGATDAFMAMELQPNALANTKGIVRYSPTFEECGA